MNIFSYYLKNKGGSVIFLQPTNKEEIATIIFFRGEYPSVLRCYTVNQKGPSSNPTRCLAGLWDPTSLQGFQ